MSAVVIREALGERRVEAADLPLSIGGAGSSIVIAGRPEGVEAYIGSHEDQLFVQPADGADVLHNGVRVERSTWLRPGDVVNFGAARVRLARKAPGEPVLEVDDGSTGNITPPPIITPAARLRGEGDTDERLEAVSFRSSDAQKPRARLTLHPGRIALAAAAVAVAFVLWFIFTAVSIGVRTVPTDARVDIDGGLIAVPVGDRVLVRPGDYRLKAQSEGYKPAQLDVQVTDAPNQQFSLQLEKLPGRLHIDVPEPARVSVDGREVGTAPAEFEVAPGKHRIALVTARYQPFTAEIEIEGAGQRQTFKPELTPNWADVTIDSQPAGAQVLVGGETRGVTPLTTQIVAGNRSVELRKEGFKPWSADLQIKANEPVTLGPIQLGLPDGKLVLASQPGGASVTIGGVYRGQTPLEVEVRPQMAHTVVLTKPGYEPATRQVALDPGERRSISVPLAGIYGEVAVRVQPTDAVVYVNGEPRGAANQTLRLVATTHEIAIRKAGFLEHKVSVTPRPGVPQVIEARLLTAEQAKLAATPQTIRTKADQTLRLMPVGRFTMGSPRREPGRRANEAQREVELKRLFYISTHEVTNGQFRRFRAAHRSGLVGQHTLDLDNQPVVNLTWEDAAQYCNWLSEQEGLPPAYERKGDTYVAVNPMTTGYRLPSDAEWEWVARRERSGSLRRYPWGDALPVAARSGNYADTTARLIVQDVVPEYDDGYATSAPVGKFPPNELGLFDVGGNVAEWVHDLYSVTPASSQLAVDPLGPSEGKQHVIRGASWRHSSVTDLRLSARDFGDGSRNDVGFRIARYAH